MTARTARVNGEMRRAASLLTVTAALLACAVLAAPVGGEDVAYRIGASDVLKITVWGHEDLTQTLVVTPDGTIALPLVGTVPAAGLTPAQLESEIRQRLGKDYLVDPRVSVVVQEHRSQRVFVLGEAEKPGTYFLTGQTRLIDVVSQAGGPARTAGQDVHVIRGSGGDGPAVPGAPAGATTRVSLRKLLDGDAAGNFLLHNGDTIFIPKAASFFVQDAKYVFSDLRTWGWIVLIIGGLQLAAAFSIWSGGGYGRWFGIATATVNAIAALLSIPAYPFWSLAIFAIDVLVIYGLAAYVWTENLERAHNVAQAIESGMVWINSQNVRDLRAPFGGSKYSGIGREGGTHSFEFFTEVQTVHVALGKHAIPHFGAE